jgi:hypothetical protein
MQLLMKTGILTLGFLLCSAAIFTEKADNKYNSESQTLEEYNQAIDLDPDNAQAYYKRGVTHENFGHPGKIRLAASCHHRGGIIYRVRIFVEGPLQADVGCSIIFQPLNRNHGAIISPPGAETIEA